METSKRGIISSNDLKRKPYFVGYVLMIAVIFIMGITMLYPIVLTFLNSFKTNAEVISFPPTFLPSSWHLDAFAEAWQYLDLPLFFRNTLIMYGGEMLFIVFVLGFAAFSLSKLRLPFKRFFTVFFMSTLFIPPTTYIIPNFLNIHDLGLIDSFWAFWLPAAGNAFFLLLLKTFFDDIDDDLFEAARMDGASELRCFFQIAFPLSIPIFATLAIFTFSTVWNDWFWPSLILHSKEKYPLATAIYKYVIDAQRLDLNVKFAVLSMVMVPPIIIFLILQRFIIRGLQLGAVK